MRLISVQREFYLKLTANVYSANVCDLPERLTRHKSERHAWCQKEWHPGLRVNIKNPEFGKFMKVWGSGCWILHLPPLVFPWVFHCLFQGTNLAPAGLMINTRKGRRDKSTESVIRRPRDTKVPCDHLPLRKSYSPWKITENDGKRLNCRMHSSLDHDRWNDKTMTRHESSNNWTNTSWFSHLEQRAWRVSTERGCARHPWRSQSIEHWAVHPRQKAEERTKPLIIFLTNLVDRPRDSLWEIPQAISTKKKHWAFWPRCVWQESDAFTICPLLSNWANPVLTQQNQMVRSDWLNHMSCYPERKQVMVGWKIGSRSR